MERRKILLGSGAALATVLAGCSSSETGDDDPDTDDDSESFGDDTDDGDDYDDNGDRDDDDDDEEHDVPGLNGDDLAFDGDKLVIEDVSRDGAKIDVVVRAETDDIDELHKEFEKFGDDIGGAIADRDHFKAEIDTIELIIEREGSRVFAVFVDVQWILDYLDDELSADEFAEKVRDTKE